METTYKNYGDYYIFNDSPETRVYLGEVSPEDYIHDQIHQAKRSASCYNYELTTGKKVSQEEAFEKSYEKGELIWREDEGVEVDYAGRPKSNFTYGYRCDYDFNRRTSLGYMMFGDKSVKYNQNDPAMERLARAYAYGQTLEEYDAQQAAFKQERDDWARKHPSLTNLMMVGGKPPYYVDDDGKEITIQEHRVLMKEKYGDDVFEKEAERSERETPPEVKKMAREIAAKIMEKKDG